MSKILPTRFIPWLAALAPIALSACNQYELFLVTGDEQVAFNGKVDVLFVIDNSGSVTEEASALLENFDTFITQLAGEGSYAKQTENLTDAVNDYITFTSDRAQAIDYNLAIITPDLRADGGSAGADPGEAGLFVGEIPVVKRSDPDAEFRFLQNAACWTACWQSTPESHATEQYTGTAGECPFPDTESGLVSSQYLGCLCNDVVYGSEEDPIYDGWSDYQLCHSGQPESPLEASLLAMCRAVENPPEICWHDASALEEPVGNAVDATDWHMTNTDWLREDSKVVVIVITDAHDNSNVGTTIAGLQNSDFKAEDPTPYLRAFDSFDRPITFAFIGPDVQCDTETGQCEKFCTEYPDDSINEGVVEEFALRMINMARATGGFYRSITEGEVANGEDCEVADFSEHLEELGNLMIDLQTVFELRAVPEEDTIRVYVDNEAVPKAESVTSGTGENSVTFGDAYENGWSYDPGQNAVVFWGNAIPDFNQDVEIFYRPLDGNPRDLPF